MRHTLTSVVMVAKGQVQDGKDGKKGKGDLLCVLFPTPSQLCLIPVLMLPLRRRASQIAGLVIQAEGVTSMRVQQSAGKWSHCAVLDKGGTY